MYFQTKSASSSALCPRAEQFEKHNQKGFNLVEAAIVLGVIGLVIGGIWVTASAVTEKYRVSSTYADVLQIADGARNMLKGFVTDTSGSYIELTEPLIYAKVIPGDIVSGTTVKTRWGGDMQIQAYGLTVNLIIATPPLGACTQLLFKSDGFCDGREKDLNNINSICSVASQISWKFTISGSNWNLGDPNLENKSNCLDEHVAPPP